jgi:hypothetical protein
VVLCGRINDALIRRVAIGKGQGEEDNGEMTPEYALRCLSLQRFQYLQFQYSGGLYIFFTPKRNRSNLHVEYGYR